LLERIVTFSHRNAVMVALLALALALAAGWYAKGHLSMDTDEARLLSAKLPWRQDEIAFARHFPQEDNQLVIVVEGKTPDETEDATRKLTAALIPDTADFKQVWRPDGGPYFIQHGLLLLPVDEVKNVLDMTEQAQPLLGTLAADPSPRGVFDALGLLAQGVTQGAMTLQPIDPALAMVDDTIKSVLAGHPHPLSWQTMLNGRTLDPSEMQHIILTQPVLDYGAFQPGGKATAAIRKAIADFGYNGDSDVRVRITGGVALSDEEFASAAKGALAATIGSMLLVIVWLLLALRSVRLILAILATLQVGFTITAGFAALTVGSLNLISVAFAVLFIGLAVDFSIQLSVRYRDERYRLHDLGQALAATGRTIAVPVAVAASATAAGFYSFLPTSFKGVSELGLIAGSGMIFAFLANIIVLPALLTLIKPPAEAEAVGYRWTAPIDRGLKRHKWVVIGVSAVVAIIGLVCVPRLSFDFNALHVKDQHSESVQTMNDLMNNPLTVPFTAEVLEPSLAEAVKEAAVIQKLPEVKYAITLDSFIPEDQDQKMALVGDAATVLLPTLTPPQVAPPPTIADIRAAIVRCRTALEAAGQKAGADPVLSALVADLKALEGAGDATIGQLQANLISSLPDRLDDLRQLLTAGPATLDSLPPELKRDWVAEDGTARIEVSPKGDTRQNAVLKNFFNAMMKVAPHATGSAIGMQQSSHTIVNAFKTAGASAVVVIALILLVALRNLADVALVLGPLLLAGLMTVIACVALPFPINFANIIALPLLLGIGVAFDIYFVMNWRMGQVEPLQSPTARAILFSALTTGTAFGSLALSAHPGTASMGVLLIISLVATLVCTLVVLPALLEAFHHGKARE
jgi:hopanoid biosynthesis associated RND transporter like protein HpnN